MPGLRIAVDVLALRLRLWSAWQVLPMKKVDSDAVCSLVSEKLSIGGAKRTR